MECIFYQYFKYSIIIIFHFTNIKLYVNIIYHQQIIQLHFKIQNQIIYLFLIKSDSHR
jgi:hypothetical protein